MENLGAQIRKWRRATSSYRYTRNDESSAQLFDAIYDNNFKLAKILIDSSKVDVNIKDECGDTPLIAVCNRRHYKLKEMLSGLLTTYGREDPSSTHGMIWGRQP
jgi:hypothetical protein